MPMVEVDETELTNLRGIQQVLGQIEKHPEARAFAQKAVALAAPDRAGPEIKIRGEVDEKVGKIESKVDAFIEELREERKAATDAANTRALEAKWLEGRGKVRAAGYTAEAVEQLEKFMEERGVADHEVAMAAFEKINPPPPQMMTGSARWDFFAPQSEAQPDLKPLFEGNEEAFLGPQIQRALAEARGQR